MYIYKLVNQYEYMQLLLYYHILASVLSNQMLNNIIILNIIFIYIATLATLSKIIK